MNCLNTCRNTDVFFFFCIVIYQFKPNPTKYTKELSEFVYSNINKFSLVSNAGLTYRSKIAQTINLRHHSHYNHTKPHVTQIEHFFWFLSTYRSFYIWEQKTKNSISNRNCRAAFFYRLHKSGLVFRLLAVTLHHSRQKFRNLANTIFIRNGTENCYRFNKSFCNQNKSHPQKRTGNNIQKNAIFNQNFHHTIADIFR